MPTLFSHDRGVIARYRSHLPVSDQTPVISLNEGSTPLIHCPKLSARVGGDCEVYVKFEGLNPTGSFKDRGMTMAMSKAAEEGAQIVICASTGNTSAAAAAYAARANLQCVVLLPAGKISLGKLAQSLVYGAKVIAIDGNFDAALRLVVELGRRPGIAVVNSINPYRIEGQKTAAFEIIDELGAAPALHILPVGNAGNITAYWKGYNEYQSFGKSASLPAMFGLQAAGSAPVYHDQVVEEPDTIATAIRIGHPASWDGARSAIRDSRGAIDIVTDAEILAAQQWLAASEGIFVEPASAASIAGLLKCCDPATATALSPSGFPTRPLIKPGSVIVCTVTGNGLKDPDAVMNTAFKPILAAADVDDVLRKSGL